MLDKRRIVHENNRNLAIYELIYNNEVEMVKAGVPHTLINNYDRKSHEVKFAKVTIKRALRGDFSSLCITSMMMMDQFLVLQMKSPSYCLSSSCLGKKALFGPHLIYVSERIFLPTAFDPM